MSEVIRTTLPFLLALYLLLSSTPIRSGEEWFKQQVEKDLGGLGVAQADRFAPDFWENAKLASQPGALYIRALVTITGLYLLLPDDTPWVFAFLVVAAIFIAMALSNRVHPLSKIKWLKWGTHEASAPAALSVLLISLGLAAAVVKLVLS